MSRNRTIAAWGVFLATFVFLLLPETRGSAASIWPSVVAVALAFITREIYTSLFLGALAGAILLSQGNPFTAFIDLFAEHLIPSLMDRWNACALVFSLMMGGFVELLNRNGSMQSLADRVLGKGDSSRRAGMGAFLMGWVVFFDGLANAMLVGKTMRPITDRAGLSREKLAFIVDSTASPIAAFALISTWIAYEMTLIQNGFEQFGDAQLLDQISPYRLLIQSLPYRFYNYFILLIVFLTIWLARDFGPMKNAERMKQRLAHKYNKRKTKTSPVQGKIIDGAAPLVILILGVFGGLYVDGIQKLDPATGGTLSLSTIIQAFGKADAGMVFVVATAFASLTAIGMMAFKRRRERAPNPVHIFFDGMKQMFLPVLILVFAFTLNSVIRELETAAWLVRVMEGNFPVGLLPSVVFLLAALISFSTGTSWGTMGILMPLCIPVAATLTGLHAGMGVGPVVIATIGAVLTGAVFGDHCSPISDTTIVSAFASGCDTIDHVRTQMPYALCAAGIAVIFGYLPVGYRVSPWLALIPGAVACWSLIRYLGRPSNESLK